MYSLNVLLIRCTLVAAQQLFELTEDFVQKVKKVRFILILIVHFDMVNCLDWGEGDNAGGVLAKNQTKMLEIISKKY